MAIVKCLNSECDYFERTVPEGDCCPYCGELLNTSLPSSQSPPQYYSPPEPQFEKPSIHSQNAPIPTVVEPINKSLKLVCANGQTFAIDSYGATSKIYLGRQDGIKSDRSIVDVGEIPFGERISRFHAYIIWDNHLNSFTVSDNNSTNGTILNGQSLVPLQAYTLHTGDRLEFGREHKVIFTIEIN